MGLITDSVSRFSDDPRFLRIPPFISLFCMLGGIIWMLMLPLEQYCRRNYISENALLPGQVHTYFGGSEQNVFHAYRHELSQVLLPQSAYMGADQAPVQYDVPDDDRNAKIRSLFKNAGLKTASQKYTYTSSGETFSGENVYAVLNAPRGDGTEAIVLIAAIRNIDNVLNLNGVTLLLSLARYFKRWSLWSKDIIFLITPDSTTGPQAWIDAYHSKHDPQNVADLTMKSGALQGGVAIDYPFDHRFDSLLITYDGVNGQLPNLDLINTAETIAGGQMGIGISIQFQHNFAKKEDFEKYPARVQTLMRGMATQALGQATGPHSVFMPYHIDAITLSTIGDGWQDAMAFGRVVESLTRSLNNLLEKLHQSFFFYLLLQCNRFVSIGTYLPSAMAVAASYTIMAVYLWVMSGYEIEVTDGGLPPPTPKANGKASIHQDSKKLEITAQTTRVLGRTAGTTSKMIFTAIDRDLAFPVALLAALHLVPAVPLYLTVTLPKTYLTQLYMVFSMSSLVLPLVLAYVTASIPTKSGKAGVVSFFHFKTDRQYTVLRSITLLILGLLLTVLATLNFSLSMILGILCVPLAFVNRVSSDFSPTARTVLAASQYFLLTIISPATAPYLLSVITSSFTSSGSPGIMSHIFTINEPMTSTKLLGQWLTQLAFGWNIWRSWGVLVGTVGIWWPAWTICAMNVASTWFSDPPKATPSITARALGPSSPAVGENTVQVVTPKDPPSHPTQKSPKISSVEKSSPRSGPSSSSTKLKTPASATPSRSRSPTPSAGKQKHKDKERSRR